MLPNTTKTIGKKAVFEYLNSIFRAATRSSIYKSINRKNTSYSNICKAINKTSKSSCYKESNSLNSRGIKPTTALFKNDNISSRHIRNSQSKMKDCNDTKITINS